MFKLDVKLGHGSKWKDMLRGWPQDSNCGLLLWNVFQNDLVYNINKSSIKMHADDHQMYIDGGKMEEVERALTGKGRGT